MAEHEDILSGAYEQLKEIFDNSTQGMYIYMDDENKVCNENFAKMLGYDSSEEWAAIKDSFPETFVAEESQETLINAFGDAMENGAGSSIEINWKKKSGESVKSNVILVPISYMDHRMALHFVSKA